MRQAPFNSQTLVVRTTGSPRALLGSIRQRVHTLDPNLPVAHVNTMSEQVASSVAQPRFQAILLGAFATLALLLGALGIYGVLSYTIAASYVPARRATQIDPINSLRVS